MARRRGLFRRLIQRVEKVFRGPKPSETEPRPEVTPSQSIPTATLRRRAVDHIIGSLPLANRRRVETYVTYMSVTELQWTTGAPPARLQWRAMQDADRLRELPNGNRVPLNPWWYR